MPFQHSAMLMLCPQPRNSHAGSAIDLGEDYESRYSQRDMQIRTPEDRKKAEQAGRLAEYLTLWIYRLQGYKCVCRRCRTPVGEIDLLLRRGHRILILEVKFRAHKHLPEEMSLPGPAQIRRIKKAALWLTARLTPDPHTDIRLKVVLWTGWLKVRVFEM